MDLAGKAILVTGGSRGLGAALGRALAREGARVVLVARGRAALERVAEEIRSAGGEAHAIVADVGKKDHVHRVAGAAAALVGPIDVLVHNASTLGPTPLRLLIDTNCEDLGHVLEVNLVGPFRLTRAVLGGMIVRGHGLVLHVTSDASVNGYARWGAYGVAKAALDHLARIWGAEVEGTGVQFLTVDPGEMNTAMHAEAAPRDDPAALADPEEVARRVLAILRRAESLPNGARLLASSEPPLAEETPSALSSGAPS